MIDTFLVVLPLMVTPGPANLVSFALGTRYGVLSLCPFQIGIVAVYAIVSLALGAVTLQVSEMAPGVTLLLSRSVVKDDGFRVVDRAAGSMLCLVGFWFMFQPLLEF